MAFDPEAGMENQQHTEGTADSSISGFKEESGFYGASGSSIREDDLTKALDASLESVEQTSTDENHSSFTEESFQAKVENNLNAEQHSNRSDSSGLNPSDESEIKSEDDGKADDFAIESSNNSEDSNSSESSSSPDNNELSDLAKDATEEQSDNSTEEASDNGAQEQANPDPASIQIDPATLVNSQELDPDQVEGVELEQRLGENGDVLDGGGGNNVVIGAGGSDIFLANSDGAFNTITTGSGEDLVVLGKDTTNRIFDFDPAADQFGLDGINVEDVSFGQGSNPDNGGLDQPLDSDNNALVIDKSTNNILASLTFTDAGELSSDNFVTVSDEQLASLTA
ncbi:hypothetical protein ACQ4M3_07470 [Leptolyngbya sp. AN03gr2]|uniref:hypothetical protein n=1 Tax=unclassified Leptolyngbya TaxID=2650499 RepID=UPI003D30FE4D